MPTLDDLVNALSGASKGVDFSKFYGQLPKLPEYTAAHSPLWMWNSATPEGVDFLTKTLSQLGFQPQQFDYLQKMQQEYPMFIYPERQMPFLKVGDYELNPARWFDYMKQGSYQQLAQELLAAQGQPAGQQAASIGQSFASPAQPLVQSQRDIMALFRQSLGNMPPERRKQLVPLVQSLIDFFRGMGL